MNDVLPQRRFLQLTPPFANRSDAVKKYPTGEYPDTLWCQPRVYLGKHRLLKNLAALSH
jgi:hypothetical protein